MKLIVKNNSDDAFSYADGSVSIQPNSVTEITAANWFALYSDVNFIKDLRLNNLIVSDGLKDYSTPESETYVTFLNSFNYNNKDIDGAMIVRTKAAKKGWSFWAVPIEINTSTIDASVFCKDSAGNNIPGISAKIYDSEGIQITVPGLANINLSLATKTVIDFEPPFDYEMIGGALRINSNPAQDVRLWIVGAPDIPAQFGGSKEFASGINLKFLAPDSTFDIDGRVSKYVTYNPVDHRGKLRIILTHPPGLNLNCQIIIHTYRL
jgi:hypothetical protein